MNIKNYIESGILEEYCLGLLSQDDQAVVHQMCLSFPEAKQRLAIIEDTLENWASARAVMPDSSLKQRILDSFDFPEQAIQFDLNNLPTVDEHSNYNSWLGTVGHLIPEEPSEDFFCSVLRHDEQFSQMLVISKIDVPEETHDAIFESFLILKGRCECTVGDNVFTLKEGDFIEIPLFQPHNVKVLSPYVVAILQHQLV
jgi:mannose-6-phosphate isomerase-like protein (cupin superfamily)